MLMEIITSASGRMTKLMGQESTCITTGPSMRVNGVRILNMVRALRYGLMVHDLKDCTKMDTSTAKEVSAGSMGQSMMASFRKMKFRAMVDILGLTDVPM